MGLPCLAHPARRNGMVATRTLLAGLLLAPLAAPLHAALPKDPPVRAAVVGQPVSVRIAPATVTLSGPRAVQQLVVTARYSDGSERDLTPFCEFRVEPAGTISVSADGFLRPMRDGPSTLTVQVGGTSASTAVTVSNF